MKNVFKGLGMGLAVSALALGMGAVSALAATTYSVNNISESGGLTVTSGGSMSLVTGTNALNLGADAAAHTVTIGNGTGNTNVTINSGTGAVLIGNNGIAHAITLGNATGATSITLQVGTGNFALDGVAASTYAIGASTTTGTITIGGTAETGAITLGSSTGAQAINIGIGGTGAKTITIGDGASTGATTIKAGSGGMLLSGSLVTNGAFNFAADAGSTDDYVITLTPAPTAYTAGMMIIFTANTANTTGATINVNGLGVKALVKGNNAALATNDIIVNRTYIAVYDGTQFDVINPATQ